MENLFAAIIVFAIGLWIFILTLKGESNAKIVTSIVGIAMMVLGVLIYLLSNDIIPEKIGAYIYCYTFALILLIALIINIKCIFCNDTKIQATLVDVAKHTASKGGTYYSPIYQYEFNKKVYTQQVPTTYTSFTARKWNIGDVYTVWIDSSDPTSVVKDRKLTFGTYCILIFFIVSLLMPIVLL